MAEKQQQQPPQAPQMAYMAPPANATSEAGGSQAALAHQHGDHLHQHPGKWSNSFWSCFSPLDTCCFAYWCPCVLFGKTHARMEDPSLRTYSPFNGYCFGFCALAYCGGLQCILQFIDRGNMRERFGIEGDGFTDCLGAWCCPICGLVQQEKESVLRLEGGAAAAAAQGYQQNPQMSYN